MLALGVAMGARVKCPYPDRAGSNGRCPSSCVPTGTYIKPVVCQWCAIASLCHNWHSVRGYSGGFVFRSMRMLGVGMHMGTIVSTSQHARGTLSVATASIW